MRYPLGNTIGWLLALFLLFATSSLHAQYYCPGCDNVVTYDVDLTKNPDSIWITPTEIGRTGQCCQATGPQRCIRFNVTTHPDAKKLMFTLASPPIPTSKIYSLNCVNEQHVNSPLCINGPGPHCIVYCKEGADILKYKIVSSRDAKAGPDIAVGNGCSGKIYASGFEQASIQWEVVYPSNAYNSYLSCTSGCDTVTVTAQPGYPDYIDVKVTGDIGQNCSGSPKKSDTVRVYFIDDKAVEILPKDPTICYGGSSVMIYADPVGGAEPLKYLWNTGETTKAIDVNSPGKYWVKVYDSTDCPPVYDTILVKQHLSAITAKAGDGTVCTESPQVLLNGSVAVATGGIWSGGSGTFSPDNTTLDALYTLSATEVTNLGTKLKLTTTGNGGCPPSSDELTITVSPQPMVDAGIDGKVCQTALSVQLNGSIIGSTNEGTWTTLGSGLFSNPQDLAAIYYPSQSDTAAGSVQLILSSKANGSCEPIRDTLNIEFGELPNTNFAFTQPACVGEPVHFNDRTVTTWGTVTQYNWDFGAQQSTDRNTSIIFNAPGTYPVTLKTTTDQGCVNEITKNVVVSTDPVASFDYTKVCYGTGVSFTNTSSGAKNYMWNFGNGFVSTMPNPSGIVYQEQTTYDVILTAINENGCRDSATQQVEMLPRPVAAYTGDNICTGDNVTFKDMSTIETGTIVSWKWDFGDGTTSTDQNPTQSFSATTPLNVKLTVASAYCSDSVVHQVTPLKKPAFFSSPTTGCSPLTVEFFNTVQPNVYYQWNFGDGNTSTLANPKNMYINEETAPKDFEATLYATSIFGCKDSVKHTVKVFPQSKSKFTTSKKSVCSGGTVSFTNTSENASSYVWQFSDDMNYVTDVSPVKTFTNNGTTSTYVLAKLITSSQYGCQDTAVEYITVYPLPNTTITQDKTESCHPAFVKFEAPTGAATYNWNFGDGSFDIGSNEMQHTFSNTATIDKTFLVTLEIESVNGCTADTQTTVTVHPSPTAKFNLNRSAGCAPFQVEILNTSKNASTYQWDFGNTTTGTDAAPAPITYTNTDDTQKSYEISLTAVSANGCTNTYSESVTVYPLVTASFTIAKDNGCSIFFADFTNTSTGADKYRWEFGDGDYSTNKDARHAFLNNAQTDMTYNVQLIAISAMGCTDTSASAPILVYPKPRSVFAVNPPSGCSPLTVDFNNQSIGASSYQWDITDGFTATTDISNHIITNTTPYVAKHSVSLIAISSNNCRDTSIQPITVYPEIVADFYPAEQGCSPLAVQFFNNSVNSTSFSWNFGDGQQSDIAEPEHPFINETNETVDYVVTLTAESDYGCTTTTSETITVYATPEADFLLNTSYLKAPNTTVFISNNTPGNWSYFWDFGDGTTSEDKDPLMHQFPKAGEYRIQYTAQSDFCKDTLSHTVTVLEPALTVDYDTTYWGCAPVTAKFINRSENAEWYSWDFGDGTTSNETHPTHTYEEEGTFVVELTAGNSMGDQKSSRKHSVTVYPVPVASFSLSPEIVFLPYSEVSFYNQSENGSYYTWYFGDSDTSNLFETTHYYQEEGVYTVSLYIETDKGCRDSLIQPEAVTVKLKCDFILPNAFTPSEPEMSGAYDPEMPEVSNDIFHPVFENIVDYKMQIFNRWGELLFESNSITVGWNGFYKGTICKQDTYVYKAEATCFGGRKISKSGSVTLVR